MQVLVVGAGVVGLAVARQAALAGHDVTVAEITGGIANGVSSRNSEVIHGGLYYPTDTLRAKLCVRGRRMLYEFCESHGVGNRKCGKLVVATNDAELAKVETIMAQAVRNGVEGVEMIGGNAARDMEEELFCIGALWSPETGIIDSHGFMLALWGEFEDRGGMIAFETPVEHMTYTASQWHVQFGGRDPGVVPFDAVVNAAGLGAQPLARRIGIEEQKRGASGDASRGENFFAADFLFAGQRDRGDAETHRVCRDIARILGPIDHGRQMLAGDRAINQRTGDEQDRSDDAGATRQMRDYGRPARGQPAIARKCGKSVFAAAKPIDRRTGAARLVMRRADRLCS